MKTLLVKTYSDFLNIYGNHNNETTKENLKSILWELYEKNASLADITSINFNIIYLEKFDSIGGLRLFELDNLKHGITAVVPKCIKKTNDALLLELNNYNVYVPNEILKKEDLEYFNMLVKR